LFGDFNKGIASFLNYIQTFKTVQSGGLILTDKKDMFAFGEKTVLYELVESDGPGGECLSDIY
jgi:hypothetical protein